MRVVYVCISFICFYSFLFAQKPEVTEVPVISYSLSPKKYEIAGIEITGGNNYDDFVLIGFSGLAVGDIITVPGDEISGAIKRFWKQGLFSDVKILAKKIEENKIWLEIQLKQRPRIAEINYYGIKKGEREDLEARLGLRKGLQIMPNLTDRAKMVVEKYFDGKGFKNIEIEILQRQHAEIENEVIVDIHINKNEKTKINRIFFEGNEALSENDLKKAMKKTNEKFSLRKRFKVSFREMFSTKKFTTTEYENDKKNIINKYNELGYRDAVLVADSVLNYTDKSVNIYLSIDEGQKYFLKEISFVGNTLYPTEQLEYILNMKPGEVYNQKKLNERLFADEDAISNIYYNNGYLFFNADPVEMDVVNDSIALEIRIQEGPQATINRVIINGNDRLYEDVVRRELRTKPGMLFSREDLIRSVRELAQMGHFDPESISPNPLPDLESGTVDIEYNLQSKANDQVEFSAGWGQSGLLGRINFKFTNFSMKNFLNPKSYKGFLPQGEGQTLSVGAQTNGRYYQSYNISFLEPWFGGKRPNTLSIGASYSKQTGVSDRFLKEQNFYLPNTGSYEPDYDPEKSLRMVGASVGYGKRLKWPDDYFQFMTSFNYQAYMLKNWPYFAFQNGTSHNINLEFLLQRNSTDNPLYTRRGSEFSFSVNLTPPYSLFDKKDYSSMKEEDKNKWIEYHKWKFKAKIYSPLTSLANKRTPVLMTRVEYGFIGSYNKHKKSPFETFYMGGDGMSGYSTSYPTETIALRGYENGSIMGNNGRLGYAYTRLGMELRYPFLLEPSSTIYGLAFVEGGNAWSDLKSFNPFDLKRSAGVGVRIFLPMIGMLGIDMAYGFDFVNNKRGGWRPHFVLGHEF